MAVPLDRNHGCRTSMAQVRSHNRSRIPYLSRTSVHLQRGSVPRFRRGSKPFSVGIPSWLNPGVQSSANPVRRSGMFLATSGGGTVSSRGSYLRFGETTGMMSGIDRAFGLDETDPWVKTCIVVHHSHTTAHSCIYSPSTRSWRTSSNAVICRLCPPGGGNGRFPALWSFTGFSCA